MNKDSLEFFIEMALREDMPSGDITSESVVSPDSTSEAIILSKEDGILAGIDIADKVFKKIDHSLTFNKQKNTYITAN